MNQCSPPCKKLKTGPKNEKQDLQQPAKNGISLKRVKVGSRKSQLALFQTNFVVDQLRKKHAKVHYDIVSMTTTGDQVLDIPLSKIGQKSLFTKELEVLLENKEVHIVVHSLKDLPTTLPPGMVIGAICKRECPLDAVVFSPEHECTELKQLPKGSVIGTSSLRRIAQLKRSHPDLEFKSVRGNINTRLRKLEEGKTYAALILATAGLLRLDLKRKISKMLDPKECMYAVGQGAIAIECLEDDLPTIELLTTIADRDTTLCCVAERAFMKALEGGCSVPVAVDTTLKDEKLTLKGGVFSLDGTESIVETLSLDLNKCEKCHHNETSKRHFCGIVAPHLPQHHLDSAERLGTDLAQCLLRKGAAEILNNARLQNNSST